MKLIVEAGATKSDWRFVEDGQQVKRILKAGINFSTMPEEAIKTILRDGFKEAAFKKFEGIYIYAAGIVTEELKKQLSGFIWEYVEFDEIEFHNDLIGAARACCQHNPGIAAIMGTGSNSCFYDGVSTHEAIMSGGFILGDDGSGAVLGKMFISDYLKGDVPEEIAKDFESKFDASYEAIIAGTYKSDSPSRYLGQIAPFVMSHYDHPYAKNLADTNFKNFIKNALVKYDIKKYPVGVVGGFGCANRELFSKLAAEYGITISRYVPEPIEGLIEYHCC